jgi:protein-S-isoprenylcysteine O-methyltransferase Ste14
MTARSGGPSRLIAGLALSYVASAFGWRTWRQWKTTGDTGIRIGSDESTEERIAGGLFAVSLIAGLATTAQAPVSRPLMRRVGVSLMGAGLAGTLAAQLDLGQSWRIGVDSSEQTDLVTDGAFAVVRNPIFSAMSMFAVGACLALGTRSAQLAAAAMIAAVQAQVRLIEEPYLERIHGDRYVEYCNAVGRFVPRLD